MNRRIYVTVLALILAVVMIFAGCSSKSETAEQTQKTEQKTTQEKQEGQEDISNFNATGYPIVNEKISLRALVNNNPTSPSDYNDTVLFQRIEEETNIHIEWILPGAGFEEKKNLMLATGDLPDLFFTGLTASDLSKYGGEGMLIPMRELVREHAPNVERLFEAVPGLEAYSTAPDGNMYGIPRINGGLWMKAIGVPMINKVWLDTLGLDIPQTIDQYADALMAFKTQDPNGNGLADEIPLVFFGPISGRNGFNAFISSFGLAVAPNYLDVVEGKVVAQAISPEYKQAMEFLAELGAEGLLDEEGFTLNKQQHMAKISGDVAIAGSLQGWEQAVEFSNKAIMDQYVFLPLMEGPDGQEPLFYEVPFSGTMRGAGAITSVNENPEATMRWIDYAYDEHNSFELCEGLIGERLIEQEDGTLIIGAPPEGMDSQAHRNSLCIGGGGLWTILPEGYEILRNVATFPKVDYLKESAFPYSDEEVLPPLFYTSEEADELSLIETTILDYIELTCSQWIKDGAVTNWDEYVETLNDMGLQQWIKINQEAYDRFSEQ